MPLPALSLSGLSREPGTSWAGGPRAAIEWAGGIGYRRLALDLTAAGIRPRELDRSARRGIAALLRRAELAVVGCDLLIPADHFISPGHVDRAIEASIHAIEFARELAALCEARPLITLELPGESEARSIIGASAEREGVLVAQLSAEEVGREGWSRLALNLPAVMGEGGDGAGSIGSQGDSLAQVRITDLVDGVRRPLGTAGGKLEPLALVAAIAAASYGACDPVIEVRGIAEQHTAAQTSLSAWPDSLL